jgi:hypothetical protein
MTRTDLLLLILTYKPGLNLSISKLQVSVFYVQHEYGHYIDKSFIFEPSEYGPVSEELLIEAEIIPELIRVSYLECNNYPEYSATMEGFEFAGKVIVEKAVVEYINDIMKYVVINSINLILKSLIVEESNYFIIGEPNE